MLALSGCGRKGGLDLPPSASSQPAAAAAVQPDPAATAQASKPNLFNSNSGSDQLPVAGKGPKRPFALDPLLNSN
jgi:predicted small lipoprotein YifL